MMTIMEKHDKAIIEAVEKLPETFTWKMLSKKLNVLGHWISPKTVRRRLTNGVVDVQRIDIGLYRKNEIYYYENGDVVGQKPKNLEAIAEKTKRPLTISEIENTEHYKALEHKNELLQAVVDDLKKDLVNVGKLQWELKDENEALKEKVKELEAIIEENVDNSYAWNDKVKQLESRNANLTELLELEMEKVKELQKYRDGIDTVVKDYRKKNLFQRIWSLFKSTDGYILFLVGWLLNGLLTLILSEVLK